MMVASSAAKPRMVFITSLVSRSFRLDLLAVMFTTTPRAPDRLTPSSRGQATACSAAMRARSTPEAAAEPIIAIPCSAITVRTSWKSTLMRPGTLMISEIPAHALEREGLGDDRNGEDAHLLGDLRNHRCGASAGAAAHSGGDEGHVRAAQGIGDLLAGLERCGAPGLGLCPCAEARRPELDLALRLGAR